MSRRIKGTEINIVEEPAHRMDIINQRFDNFEKTILSKIDVLISTSIKEHFNKEFAPLRNEISEVIKTVEFIANKHEELRSEVSTLRSEVEELRSGNCTLKGYIKDLTLKIEQLDQETRECNMEVHGLPEHSGENLLSTAVQLSKIVSSSVIEKDIISCVRAGKMNPKSTRARPIIIRLPSSHTRDHLLASCIKFNKAHPEDRLNTSHLGLGGGKQGIFVEEHLSPTNRKLKAQARAFKKDKQYKYLWVRNGRVMLRKNDTSPAIWVRSEDSLKDLKE